MKKKEEAHRLEVAAVNLLGVTITFVRRNFPKKDAIAFLIKARKYLLWQIKELRTKERCK